MLERQYCASSYVIDFKAKEVLLIYNKKLKKWLQPGGHIEGYETPIETAVREAFEETGIHVSIVGPTFDDVNFQPVSVERYVNSVGDMIDIQYLSIPLNKKLTNDEGNKTKWVPLDELQKADDVADEIKVKVYTLYNQYKNLY